MLQSREAQLHEEGGDDFLLSRSEALGKIQRRCFRYLGLEWYRGYDWYTYEFPDKPARLYIAAFSGNWSLMSYNRVRLVDTGGINRWGEGVDDWHSKVIFLSLLPDSAPIEVNFTSSGRRWRGEDEPFDYSQVEIQNARDLHEQDFCNGHRYSFSYTWGISSLVSLSDIIDLVSEIALRYPYFTWDFITWDAAESSQKNADYAREHGVEDCHCRIFAEQILERVVENGLSSCPASMDHESRRLQIQTSTAGSHHKYKPTFGCFDAHQCWLPLVCVAILAASTLFKATR